MLRNTYLFSMFYACAAYGCGVAFAVFVVLCWPAAAGYFCLLDAGRKFPSETGRKGFCRGEAVRKMRSSSTRIQAGFMQDLAHVPLVGFHVSADCARERSEVC